jgi:hypothetical protein
LSGYLSDRYDNRKLLLAYYGLRGLSLLWLPYSGFSLVGLSRTILLTYDPALIGAGIACLLAGAAALSIRKFDVVPPARLAEARS